MKKIIQQKTSLKAIKKSPIREGTEKQKILVKPEEKVQPSKLCEILSNRIKLRLEADNNKNYIGLAKAIGITSSSLYRAIKRGTVTIIMLEGIAKYLGVHPLYLLESDVIDRMAESIVNRKENPELKGFMFGFSRDVAKGMKLEEAVYKNMAHESHKNGLMI